MATAEEKQAKQDALDAQRAAVKTGQQRLQTEVGQAAAAFPQRRLRSSGDLSRYAIGGFLSDPNAPLPIPGQKPPTAPKPVATGSRSGAGSASGSGTITPGGASQIGRAAGTVANSIGSTLQGVTQHAGRVVSGAGAGLASGPLAGTGRTAAGIGSTLQGVTTNAQRAVSGAVAGLPAAAARTAGTAIGSGAAKVGAAVQKVNQGAAIGSGAAKVAAAAAAAAKAKAKPRTYPQPGRKVTIDSSGKKRATPAKKLTTTKPRPGKQTAKKGTNFAR